MPQLSDLTVDFVSLVDRAAVRDPINQSEPARFLVWKRDDINPPGGSMTPEEKAALEKAQADLKDALATIETQKADNQTLTEKVAQLEKAAEPAKKDEPVVKADLPEPVRAALEKAEAEAKANADRLAKAEETIKAERDSRLTAEFITKAEGLKALPVKPAEFGPVLKAASEKLTKDEYTALETVLKAADEQISKGDLFKEQGQAREGQRADSAYAEAVARAAELRKTDSNLSEAAALERVFKADPDLQARHLADVRR